MKMFRVRFLAFATTKSEIEEILTDHFIIRLITNHGKYVIISNGLAYPVTRQAIGYFKILVVRGQPGK